MPAGRNLLHPYLHWHARPEEHVALSPDNGSPEAWRDMAALIARGDRRRPGVERCCGRRAGNEQCGRSARKARRLLDEIGSPHLKVTMDPANLFPAGALPRMKETLDEAFALVGKDVVLCHAKDLDHDGQAGHKPAGQGVLDYDRYVSLLRKYQFGGPILLHGLTVEQVPGCLGFLRGKLAAS